MVVQFRLHARISDDRKITLELPPESPTGDVEVHLTIDDRQSNEAIRIPDLPPQNHARSGLVRENKQVPPS